MSWKNPLIRLILKFFPTRRHREKTPKRILIVSTTALGDTLWATAGIESLRTSFPNAYIGVLTSAIGMEVLKNNPFISKLYLYKNPFFLWKTLYREQFDTALIFHASQRLPLPLCSAIGASRIIGTAKLNKGLDFLLTDCLSPTYEHEITRRLRMVEAIGGKISTERLSFFLEPNEQKKLRLGPERWVALHPGSKDSFKRWPTSHFIEVGRALQEKGFSILITGVSDERQLMQQVANAIPKSSLIPEGLSLRQFASWLEKVALLISNDTGPVHLASALNRPTLAIYSSTDPRICGAHMAKKGVAISKAPTCMPCLKRKCLRPFCFLQISPSEVTDQALQMLQE